jgi:glycosyltransferase involved in cell wall biosynthesis
VSGLRVAMVAPCPLPWPRGTPIRIVRTAEALAARGHDVHVVTYHLGQQTGPLPFHLHRIPRIPTYRRTAPGPTLQKLLVADTLLRRLLGRVLDRHRPDVVHAQHYEGLLVASGPARARGLPLVYDAHTLLSSELRFYHLGVPARLKDLAGGWLDRRLPHRADHVIAVTDGVRRRLVHGFGLAPECVTVVMNGIEHAHFQGLAGDGSGGPPTLVYSGNLAPYQGVDLLLRAFRRVLDRRPDARLRLVTNSSLGEYADLARRLGLTREIEVVRSDFAGLPRQLATARVALNPRTECDGVPQKVLNYMAAGRPVVSFAGSAEVLEPGVTGLVVPDGDVEAFADAALALLQDTERAERLGAAGRERVAGWTWDRTAAGVEEVYRRVLRERRR